jgi:hypothetical protein
MRSQRLAPLSGIVFVALVAIGFIPVGGSTPDSSDSPSKITSFYVDHHNKEFVAVVLVALGTLFLAIFVASLRDRLRSGGAETWANLVLVGGAAAVAGFLFAVAVHAALADGGDHHFSADAMVAINGLDSNSFFAFSLPLAVMVLGAGGAALQTGALPRWLGWAALVLGIVSFTPVGFFAFGLIGIWIIVAGIVMAGSAEAAPGPAPAAA